jgi:DNA replication and repair protein RecF
VTEARSRALERVGPRAGDDFAEVAGERLVVRYRPSVEAEADEVEAAFLAGLRKRREDELIRRTTLVGPHRDELELAVGEMTARRFASHGEAWAAALCLRLGVAGAVGAETGDQPVLLLDDPFSGLDPVRRARVATLLDGRGQVIVAVPDEAQVPEGAAVWDVSGGRVRAR